MGLVDYGSSSASDDEPSQKRRRLSKEDTKQQKQEELPPLPASFRDLYSSTARVSASDDPSLHGGRKRTVPHVEGNWAAHVYLECTFSILRASDHGIDLIT